MQLRAEALFFPANKRVRFLTVLVDADINSIFRGNTFGVRGDDKRPHLLNYRSFALWLTLEELSCLGLFEGDHLFVPWAGRNRGIMNLL